MKKVSDKQLKSYRRIISRAVSITVLLAMLIFPLLSYYMTASAATQIVTIEERNYMEEILERLENDPNEKFTILEIVPVDMMGQVRLLAGTDEVINTIDFFATELYDTTGRYQGSAQISQILQNYQYSIEKIGSNYYVPNPKHFLNEVFGDYAYELDGRIEVKTIQANKLTVDDVNNSDIIFITSKVHENQIIYFYNLIQEYRRRTNNPNATARAFDTVAFSNNIFAYDSYGNALNDINVNGFQYYEKDANGNLISLDLSWDCVKAILEYNKNELKPVVVEYDSQGATDLNMDKLKNILLLLNYQDSMTVVNEYCSTSYESGGETYYYTRKSAADTNYKAAFNKNKVFNENTSCSFDANSIYNGVFQYNYNSYDTLYKHDTSQLNNYYWYYNGDSVLQTSKFVTVNQYGYMPGASGRVSEYSPAAYVRYLLGAKERKYVEYEFPLKILEIEPCADFSFEDTSNSMTHALELAKNLHMNTSGWTTDPSSNKYYKNYLDVTSLTTNAFNGTNTDIITEYDLIYIGCNDGRLVKDYSGKTDYNDNNLDGYVYTAYGDLYTVKGAVLGSLDTDYYMTNKKPNNYTLQTVTGIRGTNNRLLTGYVYKVDSKNWSEYLASKLTNGKIYLLNSTGTTRLSGNDITVKKYQELLQYANAGMPIVLSDDLYYKNDKKLYPTANMTKLVNTITADDNYKVISNRDIIQIYGLVRTDAPVIFINKVPKEVTYTATGVINSFINVENGVYNPDNRAMNFNVDVQGIPGKQYCLQLILDKNGDGIYNYEFTDNDKNEVYSTSYITIPESGIYNDYTLKIDLPYDFNGLVSWKLQASQVINGHISEVRSAVYGNTAIRGDKKQINVLQIIPVSNGSTAIFRLDDTRFTTLLNNIKDVIAYDINIDIVTSAQFEDNFEHKKYQGDCDSIKYLGKDYDMIIIGFAEVYAGDDISNVNGAVTFIDDFISIGKSVLFTHDTIDYYTSVNQTVNMSGYTSRTIDMSRVLRRSVGLDRFGVTLADKAGIYIPTVAETNEKITQIHGLSNMAVLKYSTAGGFTQPETTLVSKLNNGQVTQYPYNINEQLTVSRTHCQWLQLDLEDESTVVWYTLAADGSSANNAYYENNRADATNNYYIYSKANVTYSGAGHTTMNSTEELKLFVNTIIKAITAGNFTPEVKFNNASVNTDGNYIMRVNELDDNYSFSFTAKDNDLLEIDITSDSNDAGTFEYGKLVWVKNNGTEVILNEYYRNSNPIKNGIPVIYLAGGALQNQMKLELKEHEILNIYVEVEDMYGAEGKSYLAVIPRDLFLLD